MICDHCKEVIITGQDIVEVRKGKILLGSFIESEVLHYMHDDCYGYTRD